MIKSSDAKPIETAKEAEIIIQTANKVQKVEKQLSPEDKLKEDEEEEIKKFKQGKFKGKYTCNCCFYTSNSVHDLYRHIEKYSLTHNIHEYVLGDNRKRYQSILEAAELHCVFCCHPYTNITDLCKHIWGCKHNTFNILEVPSSDPAAQNANNVEIQNNQVSAPNNGSGGNPDQTGRQNNQNSGGAPNPPNPSRRFIYPMRNIGKLGDDLQYATYDLSRQCNKSDQAALEKVWEECLMLIAARHGDLAVGLNWLLQRFRRRPRRDNLPNNFDELTEEQIKNITQSQVSYNMSLNSASKSLRQIQSNMARIRFEELDVDEKKKQIEKYFVNNESKVSINQPHVSDVSQRTQFDKIDVDTLLTVINKYDDSTSPSVSGLAPRHWKKLSGKRGFLEFILKLFNEILENPEICKKIPNLFRFQEVFIPKDASKTPEDKQKDQNQAQQAQQEEMEKKSEENKRYRPICFSEILLNIFEKCILKQVQEALPTIDEQFCNKSNGLLKAKAKLIARKQGKNLIVLDIHNAFIMKFQDLLLRTENAPNNCKLIEYLLDLRHSELQEKVYSGTPQGSPLSSVLFTAAINPVLEHIKMHGNDLAAYADDICLIVDNEKSQEALKCATKAFKSIGLTLTEEKCQNLHEKGEVEFLGQQFKQQAVCMADDILVKLSSLKEAIMKAKLHPKKFENALILPQYQN